MSNALEFPLPNPVRLAPVMNLLKAILACLMLCALGAPCLHAGEHHHDASDGVELCGEHHADCHSCSDEPCSKPVNVSLTLSTVVSDLPIRQTPLIHTLSTDRPRFVAVPRPPGDLQCLQTVQLLI